MGVVSPRRRSEDLWPLVEEVVERAVAKAKDEFSREIASALKTLAEYMKAGFEKTHQTLLEHAKTLEEHSKNIEELFKRIEEHTKRMKELSERVEELSRRIEDHSKIIEEHSKRIEKLAVRVEELAEAVLSMTKELRELKIAVGSTTRRLGLDFEKAVLNVYRDTLLGLGVRDVSAIEKFSYIDVEGKYVARGGKIEVDIYMHDNNVYLIEVKSLLERDDVEWINWKFHVASQILGKPVTRKIVVAVHATEEALKRARELGIDVVYGAVV